MLRHVSRSIGLELIYCNLAMVPAVLDSAEIFRADDVLMPFHAAREPDVGLPALGR
jgi:hypothetical protein